MTSLAFILGVSPLALSTLALAVRVASRTSERLHSATRRHSRHKP
jgi:multidrug efflux pump subunit AcrB